jgi:hypothetical protein
MRGAAASSAMMKYNPTVGTTKTMNVCHTLTREEPSRFRRSSGDRVDHDLPLSSHQIDAGGNSLAAGSEYHSGMGPTEAEPGACSAPRTVATWRSTWSPTTNRTSTPARRAQARGAATGRTAGGRPPHPSSRRIRRRWLGDRRRTSGAPRCSGTHSAANAKSPRTSMITRPPHDPSTLGGRVESSRSTSATRYATSRDPRWGLPGHRRTTSAANGPHVTRAHRRSSVHPSE